MKNCDLINYLSTLPPNAEVVHKIVDKVYQPLESVSLDRVEDSRVVKFQIVFITNNANEKL